MGGLQGGERPAAHLTCRAGTIPSSPSADRVVNQALLLWQCDTA